MLGIVDNVDEGGPLNFSRSKFESNGQSLHGCQYDGFIRFLTEIEFQGDRDGIGEVNLEGSGLLFLTAKCHKRHFDTFQFNIKNATHFSYITFFGEFQFIELPSGL